MLPSTKWETRAGLADSQIFISDDARALRVEPKAAYRPAGPRIGAREGVRKPMSAGHLLRRAHGQSRGPIG